MGERLVAAETISDDDYILLQHMMDAYDSALTVVQDCLRGLGFTVTGRLKTTDVLIDKLRRERGMKLKAVQDVAGVRIVLSGTREEQDEAACDVVAAFTSSVGKPPRVRDRRLEPSSGYRAVHVVVFQDGLPVEVQVRTELQHLWAQAYEKLADRWGRAMRYGGEPDRPDAVVPGSDPPLTRRAVVAEMQRLSDEIDQVERARLDIRSIESGQELLRGDRNEPEYLALAGDLEEFFARLVGLEGTIRQTLDSIVRSARWEG